MDRKIWGSFTVLFKNLYIFHDLSLTPRPGYQGHVVTMNTVYKVKEELAESINPLTESL